MNKSGLKPEIQHGIIGTRYFVVAIFDDEHIIHPMQLGLEKFFKEWGKHLECGYRKEKRKKEANQGYLTLSGSSSGCRRK